MRRVCPTCKTSLLKERRRHSNHRMGRSRGLRVLYGMQYAMSVIVGRALPDVRDGLKPVHRRILYAMQELGLQPTTPYRHALSPVTIWH